MPNKMNYPVARALTRGGKKKRIRPVPRQRSLSNNAKIARGQFYLSLPIYKNESSLARASMKKQERELSFFRSFAESIKPRLIRRQLTTPFSVYAYNIKQHGEFRNSLAATERLQRGEKGSRVIRIPVASLSTARSWRVERGEGGRAFANLPKDLWGKARPPAVYEFCVESQSAEYIEGGGGE